MYVKSRNVLIGDVLKPATLHVVDGKIKDIMPYEFQDAQDYGNCYIAPGFIDLHMHGGYGFDVLDDDQNSFTLLRRKLLDEGTTSFLATSTTLEKEMLKVSLAKLGSKIGKQIAGDGASCLGIHLEGPFLNPKFAGAQKSCDILEPTIALFQEFQSASDFQIKRITLAPEMDIDHSLITNLSNQEILVSIGHTGADAKEARAAFVAGSKLVTHMFNGMPPFHHREIGVSGMALLCDGLSCEFIADGIHVSFDAIELACKVKGSENLILITDSNKSKGLPPGEYVFHGRNIVLNEQGEARIKETGSLAGSTAKMNMVVKNIIQNTTIDRVEAFKMASLYPARLINVDDSKGLIDIGYDADFVVLDQQYQVIETFAIGKRKDGNR